MFSSLAGANFRVTSLNIIHLQFRARLIFLIFTNDERAVGIEVKSLSLISSTLRPWHKNNCRGSSVIWRDKKGWNLFQMNHTIKSNHSIRKWSKSYEIKCDSPDSKRDIALRVCVHIGTHQLVHHVTNDVHNPRRKHRCNWFVWSCWRS